MNSFDFESIKFIAITIAKFIKKIDIINADNYKFRFFFFLQKLKTLLSEQ